MRGRQKAFAGLGRAGLASGTMVKRPCILWIVTTQWRAAATGYVKQEVLRFKKLATELGLNAQ